MCLTFTQRSTQCQSGKTQDQSLCVARLRLIARPTFLVGQTFCSSRNDTAQGRWHKGFFSLTLPSRCSSFPSNNYITPHTKPFVNNKFLKNLKSLQSLYLQGFTGFKSQKIMVFFTLFQHIGGAKNRKAGFLSVIYLVSDTS